MSQSVPLSLSLKHMFVTFDLEFVSGLLLPLGLGYCFSLLTEFGSSLEDRLLFSIFLFTSNIEVGPKCEGHFMMLIEIDTHLITFNHEHMCCIPL